MKSFFKRSFVLIIAIILGYMILPVFRVGDNWEFLATKMDKVTLEKVYFLSQIVASCFVAIGALIAVWQYYLSSKAEIARYNNEKVQKAVDMAEYYKDEILTNYGLLKDVFEETKLKNIICKVKIGNMEAFDQYELKELFDEDTVQEIREKLSSAHFADKILESIRKRGFRETNVIIDDIIKKREDDKGYILSKEEIKEVSVIYTNRVVNETLNRLEYFSMNFTHGTADESVVFASLSPTFLEIVQLLYYNIAINNNERAHYFSNVIKLFNIWKEQTEEKKKRIVATTRSVFPLGATTKSV